MKTNAAHAACNVACENAIYRPYFPFVTLKCVGAPLYRSRGARDYACLLDLDSQVLGWQCFTHFFNDDTLDRKFTIDFTVQTRDHCTMVEVWERPPENTIWVRDAAARAGYGYEAVFMPEIRKQPRLQNAKDLIRYAGYDAPLGDRIRLSAALADLGSLTLAECLAAVRDGLPMRTMAALILQGHVEVDLDEALLGPDTIVRLPNR
jgi:hypothetical protein